MPLILPKPGTHTLEEKRSRFIGYCTPIKSESEAKDVIEDAKNRYQDASHNVYAYSITGGAVRFSDDGEPSGTAGMPVLNVFQRAGVIDFVCVVTRYFGGTLLGAGGLVRAYAKAAKGAMDDAAPEEQIFFTIYKVTCAYNRFDKLKHRFNAWGIEILDVAYTDHCEVLVQVRDDQAEPFLQGDFYIFEVKNADN